MPVRQHILFSPLKNSTAQKQKKKKTRELFFLECFAGAVIFFVFIIICKNFKTFAHIHESVLIMVCDVNACYYFFFMMLCLSVKERRNEHGL